MVKLAFNLLVCVAVFALFLCATTSVDATFGYRPYYYRPYFYRPYVYPVSYHVPVYGHYGYVDWFKK